MSIVVIADVIPVPGRTSEVIEAFDRVVPQVHTEPGCELYALHTLDDGSLLMIEKWADQDALATHGRGEHFAALTAALDGLLAEPLGVRVLAPHPTGDADKGAV